MGALSNLDNERKQAEIDKLIAETNKFNTESENIGKHSRLIFWSEVTKIIGAIVLGLGGLIAAITQFELAEFKKQNAEAARDSAFVARDIALKDMVKIDSELEEKKQAVSELKDELARLTNEINNKAPSLIENQLVYVQFQGSIQRSLINEYRIALSEFDFNAPGSERRAGQYGNEIRYFKDADFEMSNELAEITHSFFVEKGCPLDIRLVPITSQFDDPPSQIEVWIHHSCK